MNDNSPPIITTTTHEEPSIILNTNTFGPVPAETRESIFSANGWAAMDAPSSMAALDQAYGVSVNTLSQDLLSPSSQNTFMANLQQPMFATPMNSLDGTSPGMSNNGWSPNGTSPPGLQMSGMVGYSPALINDPNYFYDDPLIHMGHMQTTFGKMVSLFLCIRLRRFT